MPLTSPLAANDWGLRLPRRGEPDTARVWHQHQRGILIRPSLHLRSCVHDDRQQLHVVWLDVAVDEKPLSVLGNIVGEKISRGNRRPAMNLVPRIDESWGRASKLREPLTPASHQLNIVVVILG
jgi:hypothetical protein